MCIRDSLWRWRVWRLTCSQLNTDNFNQAANPLANVWRWMVWRLTCSRLTTDNFNQAANPLVNVWRWRAWRLNWGRLNTNNQTAPLLIDAMSEQPLEETTVQPATSYFQVTPPPLVYEDKYTMSQWLKRQLINNLWDELINQLKNPLCVCLKVPGVQPSCGYTFTVSVVFHVGNSEPKLWHRDRESWYTHPLSVSFPCDTVCQNLGIEIERASTYIHCQCRFYVKQWARTLALSWVSSCHQSSWHLLYQFGANQQLGSWKILSKNIIFSRTFYCHTLHDTDRKLVVKDDTCHGCAPLYQSVLQNSKQFRRYCGNVCWG